MVLLMAMMWLSVVIPPQATALLPLIVLPVLGIAPAKNVAAVYYGGSVISLICSAAFAVTMDRSRVLRRGSLMLLGWGGFVYRPLALCVLFAVSTALLAALARPTLAVTVMSAAARALILELQRASMLKYSRQSVVTAPGDDPRAEREDPEIRLLITDFSIQLRALLLLVSFSSHIGSFLLPSGHESLIHLKRTIDSHMNKNVAPSAFFWLSANGPCVVVLLGLNVTYIYLVYLRRLDVRDVTPTVLVFLLLAFMPVQALEMASKERALHWKSVLPHVPWGLGLVLASGNAIAVASKKCGLSEALLEWGARGSSPLINQALLMVGAAMEAQMSMQQIDDSRIHKFFEKAQLDHVYPLYYVWPAATASCFSFVLPSASAANLMVYHYSDLLFADMVIPSTLNLVASVLVCLGWYQVVLTGPPTPAIPPSVSLNRSHAILYIDQ